MTMISYAPNGASFLRAKEFSEEDEFLRVIVDWIFL